MTADICGNVLNSKTNFNLILLESVKLAEGFVYSLHDLEGRTKLARPF